MSQQKKKEYVNVLCFIVLRFLCSMFTVKPSSLCLVNRSWHPAERTQKLSGEVKKVVYSQTLHAPRYSSYYREPCQKKIVFSSSWVFPFHPVMSYGEYLSCNYSIKMWDSSCAHGLKGTVETSVITHHVNAVDMHSFVVFHLGCCFVRMIIQLSQILSSVIHFITSSQTVNYFFLKLFSLGHYACWRSAIVVCQTVVTRRLDKNRCLWLYMFINSKVYHHLPHTNKPDTLSFVINH